MSYNYDVIVIGGGMAGLAAAAKLSQNGVNNVLLVEASDRLGGRMRTTPFRMSRFIELGAQDIHGSKGNPLYDVAKQNNLIDDKKFLEGYVYHVTQDGKKIDDDFADNISEKLEELFDEKLENVIENNLSETSNESLGNLLEQDFARMLKKMKSNSSTLNTEVVKALYKSRIHDERIDNACDDLNRLSALGWNEGIEFEGEEVRLKQGFQSIVQVLHSQFGGKTKLNEKVERVDWTHSRNNDDDEEEKKPSSSKPKDVIQVHTLNKATNSRQVYSTKFVIVTSSLGYLKRNHQEMFTPMLPREKVRAINNLGFGVLNKLHLVFDKPVFDTSYYQGLKILWRDDLSDNIISQSMAKWKFSNTRFHKSLDYFEAMIPHMPNVLQCFTVGADSAYIESLSDEALTDVISELFTKCFPELQIPRPKQIIRSKWSTDSNALGAYAYIQVGSDTDDCDYLAEPVNNRMFFAGEATTYKFLATTHGAYITGREAADAILKKIKRKK